MMKLKLFAIFAAAALLLGMTGCSKEDKLDPMPDPSAVVWEKGVLPGHFTVNADGLQVQFAQGNLQYQASSHTWRFAEHQYDIVGDAIIGNVYENGVKSDNTKICSDYNGWIDLYGWGTGVNPTLATTESEDYIVYSEWGNNAIQNSTGYTWRTLANDEIVYLFHGRTNAATLFGFGSVDGVNGVILLPDNWTLPAGLSFTPSTTKGLEWNGTYYFNENADNYSHNTYTTDEWTVMEYAGAVFLPAAGYREGTTVSLVGKAIDYWSATQDGTAAGGISGNSKRLHPQSFGDLCYGDCVRLVR